MKLVRAQFANSDIFEGNLEKRKKNKIFNNSYPNEPMEVQKCLNASNNTAGDIFLPGKKDIQRWAVNDCFRRGNIKNQKQRSK